MMVSVSVWYVVFCVVCGGVVFLCMVWKVDGCVGVLVGCVM